jgi:NADPH-dependent ferric siderophore reductase
MHEITKIRREPVRRLLHVKSKEYVTPRMLRIVFESNELQGFDSPSPDDHIKIFLAGNADDQPIMRDFTPRAWDEAGKTFTLEFALHEHGPAAEWARAAQVGDPLPIGGPRGSTVVTDDFDWYWLIGDAAALPSIARRLEALRPGVATTVFALVPNEEEQQTFSTETLCTVHWLHSTGNLEQDSKLMAAAMKQQEVPNGDGFVWIACESSVSHQLYNLAVEELKLPKQWIKASSYWDAK